MIISPPKKKDILFNIYNCIYAKCHNKSQRIYTDVARIISGNNVILNVGKEFKKQTKRIYLHAPHTLFDGRKIATPKLGCIFFNICAFVHYKRHHLGFNPIELVSRAKTEMHCQTVC